MKFYLRKSNSIETSVFELGSFRILQFKDFFVVEKIKSYFNSRTFIEFSYLAFFLIENFNSNPNQIGSAKYFIELNNYLNSNPSIPSIDSFLKLRLLMKVNFNSNLNQTLV